MKSKCSFILKTSVALLLAILMVLGSVSTVIAAVVDVSTGDQSIPTAAKKGLDIAGTAANADLTGSGADESGTAFGSNYLYVDFSLCSSRTFKGVDKYWGAAYSNKDGWVGAESCTDISGYIYRVPVNSYNRAFQILDSNNNKVNATVPTGAGVNWFKVNSSFNGGTWGDMPRYSLMNGTGNINANSRLAFFSGSGSSYSATVSLTDSTTYNLYVFDNLDLKDWRANNTFTRANSSLQIYNYGSMNNNTSHTFSLAADATDDYTFSFPATNGGNFTVTWPVLVNTYDITKNSMTNGDVSLSKTSAEAGETITLTIHPNFGYLLDSISATGVTLNGSGNTDGSTRTFTMPSADVVVSASFTADSSTSTIYVVDEADWGANIYVYPYEKDKGPGVGYSWPGQQISTNNPIGTIGGKNVYQVTVPAYCPYLILDNGNNGGKQYNGNNAVALTAGKLYPTVSSTSTPSTGTTAGTIRTYSSSLLDKPKYDVTFTPSPTGGTVKVDNSSTSPVKVAEDEDFTILAKPNTGYTVDTVKVDTTTLTAQSGGSDASGYTYTYNVGQAAKTVTATFKKVNYTVTLDKNATSATAGTASVTATYGDAMPSATMPTRTGYTFQGYYDTNATSGGTQYYTAAGASARTWDKTDNTTLYARWSAVTGAVKAAAYTSGQASTDGGTVTADLSGVTIDSTDKSITATKKTNYDFLGWTITGTKATNLYYRFGTSGDWTPVTAAAASTPVGTSNTTIYIKTDGSSGITTSTAEVRAMFAPTDYTGLTVGAQYTLDNSSYTDFSPALSGVTIAANHGTNQTGVAVTAPATDPTGYEFAGWYSAKGSFDNPANKDTVFKPNDTGAKAIARYRKIHAITISVDNTGTGAGTATTSVASVVAGGSYTITANAAAGSAVESVKVNDTAKTATESQTISSVSADQTVVVKFKSNVTIRGNGAIGTDWGNGDQMTSNATGTEFTKSYSDITGSASGTTYEFKLHNGSSFSDDATASVTINGGDSTGTLTEAAAGVNWKLTLKKDANVTIKSDGTKITEIKVVPANATKYAVTFKKADNTTITGQYEGTNFSTASEDATLQVYEGDEVTFTVTAANGYHISDLTSGTTPDFSPAVTKEYKLTNITAAKTITPTAAADVTITAKTNKSSRGTVTVDKNTSYVGDTVTITVTPLSGSLKSLTATYGNGRTYEYKNGSWAEVIASGGSSNTGAFANVFLNPAKAAFNAAPTGSELDMAAIAAMPDLVSVGSSEEIVMVMQHDSTVTINATFDPYSAASNYYYNGYNTSGNLLSDYTKKQMTEVMLEGVPYSYYQVSGRSGSDQLMTVSKQSSTGNTGYAYFTRPSDWGDTWKNNKAPYAYFFSDSGQVGTSYPGDMMTWIEGNDFKIEIPDGATKVIFSDSETGGSGAQTVDITMSTTTSAYYLNGQFQDVDGTRKYKVSAWDNQPSDAGIQTTTTEYWYNAADRYYGHVNGFNETNNSWASHNAGSHSTDNNRFAKPNENTGDKSYYVMVFYAGNKYTSGSGTLDLTGDTNHDVVMWSYELPSGADDENVTVYAKDGSIRAETFGSTYANIADTKIYAADGTTTVGTKHNGSITNQTYETYKAAKGDTIVIKTQIGATDSDTLSNAADLKAKYYVRGFCINGEVSQLLEPNDSGLYTLTFKVPEDGDITKFEITPIYYLKDTTNNPIVTYRVTGFTDELKAVGAGKPGWGDTLYTYPYYGKLGGQNNAFGAYPGQPMVYYKGQYQMQIPQKDTAWDIYESDAALDGKTGTEAATAVSGTTVSGVTMSNGYWDSVHKMIQGYGDNSASADHVQTYDYGDFYKIFNEKKPVDNIVFDFKYETTKHNFESNPAASYTKTQLDTNYGTNGNGFELLTNFHGRNVDLFGDPLTASQATQTPVYVVSIGGVKEGAGVENIAGYYATEWMVYGSSNGTDYSRIEADNKISIPPEVLVLNDDDATSFNTTTYPSADANHTITDWQALYTALEAYRGKPVMISYEAADAQQGQGLYYTGSGGATRNDGRWLYSKNGENITSTIKIQYSDNNGATYTDLDTTDPEVAGLSAYFTNDGVEGQMTYSTTIDPDKTFDFEAKTTNGNYKFVGWYMADGTKITSDNIAHTERSGSYTFVAKFMQVQSGQLILSHSADKGTVSGTNYQGAGTAKISAVVKNGDEVIRTYDLSTSDITLDDKIIKSDSTYTIDVTLEATATGNDELGTTVLATPNGGDSTYFLTKSSTDEGKKRTIVLNSFTVQSLFSGTTQNVKNIIYHSYFTQSVFTYTLTFQYTDRFNASKSFTRQGQLTSAQVANKEYVSENNGSFKLLPAFIQTVAPYESNFGEDITWNINEAAFTHENNIYNCTATISASQTKETKVNVTFKLPYAHENGIATGGNSGTAATTTDFALTDNNAVRFDSIPVLPNGVNGIYTEDEKKNWIAAPKTITGNGTTQFFQYWSVKKTSADGGNDPELARCYFQGFNFVALDNYTITPIYGTASADITESGIYSGVSYLETSRNQWNDNTEAAKTATGKASDLLYNDFVLNYNFKGAEIYKNGTDVSDIQELGVVVERVQELGINQDGSKDTDISHYTSLASDTDNVTNAAYAAATDGQATYKANGKQFYKQVVNKTSLDNKNRILFYDAFYNGAGWNMAKQTSAAKYTYKNYVYRAYTYIKYTNENNETVVQLAEAPAYFTMYDEATASYKAPTSNTSGN